MEKEKAVGPMKRAKDKDNKVSLRSNAFVAMDEGTMQRIAQCVRGT